MQQLHWRNHMIFEKLDREEKEAEELLFGKREVENLEEPKEEATTPTQPQEPEVTQPVVEEEDDKNSWKKRFTNFKATADNTIFKLRKENAALKSDIATIAERNEVILSELVELKKKASSKMKEESFNEVFTQEDVDLLGPEAIDVFKRAVKKVSNPEENEELKVLKDEVRQLKQEKIRSLKKEQEDVDHEEFSGLKVKLAKLVPDWEEIDVDPNFLTFLDELDEVELVPRKELFSSAVQSRRAKNVATFYNEFKSQRPLKKDDILSKKITPVGNGGAPMNTEKDNNKKTYTIEEYNKFMDDYTKGRYRGKEKEAKLIESKFDKAFLEGRIV